MLVCASAGIMTVNNWAQNLMGHDMPNYTKFDVHQYSGKDDIIAWPHPTVEEEVEEK